MKENNMLFKLYNRKRKERGITLIEVAMAIAIMALVTAAIMWAYQAANVSRQTETAMKDLASLQNSVRTLYGNQSDYAGIDVEDMIMAKVVPRRMVQESGGTATLRNAFNGPITILSEDVSGTDDGFSILFEDVPGEACARLAVLDLGTGLAEVDIGGTVHDENAFPIATTDAINQCGETTQDLTWTFR